MITIFTPSFADESDTNAQNLTVKEVVSRLPAERCRVVMLHENAPDPRIAARPNTRLVRFRGHGNTARALWHLVGEIPDVYFFPREGPLDAAFVTMRHYLRWKTALVTYIVSGGLYNENYVPARVRNIREADAVVANNEYLAQLLQEKMGVSAETIYDGVDRRYYFSDDRPRDHAPAVLFAGSFRPYKRAPVVIQQAARWPQVRFRLAGIGEEEQKCRALAAELGCENVEFLGHLPALELGEQMRRADIFFFPSMIEGHPQVLVQAAASGLPAVAMNVYRPDYVVEGKTGFLADSDDELAHKLDLLITQPGLRRTMREAAIQHARQFDWDRIAKRWQEVFEAAAAARRGGVVPA